MKREFAEQILLVAQECSRRMDKSVELAQREFSGDDYKHYGRMAGKIMAGIFENIMAPIYDEHPDLAPEWYIEMNRKLLKRSGEL